MCGYDSHRAALHYDHLSLSLILTKCPSTINYQRPCPLNIRFPTKRRAVPPLSLICHRKCHHFILWMAAVTGATLSLLYFLRLPFSPFSFCPPLTPVSAFHVWQMIGRLKVFSVSILLFPKRGQKGGGGELSAAGFTEEMVQNCLIPAQISECIQSRAKCYCVPQFGHYTLSLTFREALPN